MNLQQELIIYNTGFSSTMQLKRDIKAEMEWGNALSESMQIHLNAHQEQEVDIMLYHIKQLNAHNRAKFLHLT